jgi:hypothetical protein
MVTERCGTTKSYQSLRYELMIFLIMIINEKYSMLLALYLFINHSNYDKI